MAEAQDKFPGPEVKARPDIPNVERIKKPGIISTLSSVGTSGLTSFMNGGIFPIAGQEPLTEMQRKAEMFEFASILEKAARSPRGSTHRLLLVTAFNIFGWTGACLRTEFKAMRPMDYETFDFVSPELGFSFLTEFVKLEEDNRYISTCQAHGMGWSLTSESCSIVKLATTSIYFNGNYAAELTFDDGDVYILSMPSGYASGIATGSPVFSYSGKATAEHSASLRSTEVDLTEPGMLSTGKKHRVKGCLLNDGKKSEELKIVGTWDGLLEVVWQDGRQEPIAAYKVTGPSTKNKYNLPHLAVQLNHMPDDLAHILPPTDSRRRLDLRYLESGLFEEADEERARLLTFRDEMRAAGIGKPRWFSPRTEPLRAGPEEKLLRYKYDGGYWETRAAAARIGPVAWKDCSNIFGLHT